MQTPFYTAVLDACVLLPAPLRDLLMRLANENLFRAKWTDQIHDEWTRNLLKIRPDLDPAKIRRTRELMNIHAVGALVKNYERLINSVSLPDPDDRHVVAAAITCGADVIVTFNLKDFPAAVLQNHGLVARHPDDFICRLITLSPAAACAAVKRQRDGLKSPKPTATELLSIFERQGLPKTVASFRERIGDL